MLLKRRYLFCMLIFLKSLTSEVAMAPIGKIIQRNYFGVTHHWTPRHDQAKNLSLGQSIKNYCHVYLLLLLALFLVAITIGFVLCWKYLIARTYPLLQRSDVFTRVSERMRWGPELADAGFFRVPNVKPGKLTTGGRKPAIWAANNQMKNFLEIAGRYKSNMMGTADQEMSLDIHIVQNAHEKCPHPSKCSLMIPSNNKPIFENSRSELRCILKEAGKEILTQKGEILTQKGVDVSKASEMEEPQWSIIEARSETFSISHLSTDEMTRNSELTVGTTERSSELPTPTIEIDDLKKRKKKKEKEEGGNGEVTEKRKERKAKEGSTETESQSMETEKNRRVERLSLDESRKTNGKMKKKQRTKRKTIVNQKRATSKTKKRTRDWKSRKKQREDLGIVSTRVVEKCGGQKGGSSEYMIYESK